jgi:hypothetical protein
LNHPAQYTNTYFEEANPFSEITPKWVKHFAHLSLRKVNSKGSPLVQLAFHTDLAAMCLNQLLGNRQAQAAAGSPRAFPAPETIEYKWQILSWDAAPVVSYLDEHALLICPGAQLDHTTWLGVT